MGYCITMTDENFKMKQSNFEEALKCLKNLAQEKYLKWVTDDLVLDATTFEEAMDACRYTLCFDEEYEDVVGIEFNGEKLGNDDDIFTVIAPFVESGSYIKFAGEDGDRWQFKFKDGKMKTK